MEMSNEAGKNQSNYEFTCSDGSHRCRGGTKTGPDFCVKRLLGYLFLMKWISFGVVLMDLNYLC